MNLASAAAFFRWKPAAWLRITGEDAARFLQGQFSQDLGKLGAGEAVYGLWLNVKGKVVADSFVLRSATPAPEYFVGSYFSAAATIRERLEAFVIADDVFVEDLTETVVGVSLIGGKAGWG
ncbi:MAG: hypothetical protein RLZZ15_3957, partial [Verrucomicrobiota bacterium]